MAQRLAWARPPWAVYVAMRVLVSAMGVGVSRGSAITCAAHLLTLTLAEHKHLAPVFLMICLSVIVQVGLDQHLQVIQPGHSAVGMVKEKYRAEHGCYWYNVGPTQ